MKEKEAGKGVGYLQRAVLPRKTAVSFCKDSPDKGRKVIKRRIQRWGRGRWRELCDSQGSLVSKGQLPGGTGFGKSREVRK